MSPSGLLPESSDLLEPLSALEPRLSCIGRAELAAVLAPIVGRLAEPVAAAEWRELAPRALSLCRKLYANARSGDALILARAVLFQAALTDDPLLERRASIVCGLLAADTADIVEAIEHYVNALRLSADDPVEASGIWNNIGLAMGIAGNYEMAGRCYERALDLLRERQGREYVRYAACVNLAQSHFHLASHAQGIGHAERALAEQTQEFIERDAHVALLLRRNLVHLLVALGRIDEAPQHVAEAAALADRIRTPRALIAAATARAVHELATGGTDVGLTRLEKALSHARQVPGALRDTLACTIAAEEAAGHSERALLRLNELSEHVYRSAIDKARGNVELAAVAGFISSRCDAAQEQARARLISKQPMAAKPESWDALDRMAVSAALRMDRSGWHGKRVGALSKALALASGMNPLQALEIGFAAELHDIGMLSVPEELLARKGTVRDVGHAIVRRHIDAGAEILGDDRHPRIFLAREIARYHHARWDGEGYPERVGHRFIPVEARICAIADAYDEMVSGLAGPASSMDQALAELRRGSGSRFDPELVACFDRMVREESEDLGVDLASTTGMEAFQELVNALREDRGFV
jgi:putative two-component system response regulator